MTEKEQATQKLVHCTVFTSYSRCQKVKGSLCKGKQPPKKNVNAVFKVSLNILSVLMQYQNRHQTLKVFRKQNKKNCICQYLVICGCLIKGRALKTQWPVIKCNSSMEINIFMNNNSVIIQSIVMTTDTVIPAPT
jgi:hypothetical protein